MILPFVFHLLGKYTFMTYIRILEAAAYLFDLIETKLAG